MLANLTDYENCSIWNGLRIIRPKWTIQIILEIMVSPETSLSFSELEKLIPDINPRMLSNRLKDLCKYKIIESFTENPKTPKKVRYKLTKAGAGLVHVIVTLRDWSTEFISENPDCKNDTCRHILRLKLNFAKEWGVISGETK